VTRSRGSQPNWPLWLLLVISGAGLGSAMNHWWAQGQSAPMAPAAVAPMTSAADPPAASSAPAGDVQVFFSRRDQPQQAIIQALGAAKSTILVAMYTFTDSQLGQALIDAHARGVQVTVYLDRSQAGERYSQAQAIAAAGIPVRISNNPHIMHNKFAVLDDAVVITGSYNWTHAADVDNDENLLILRDPQLAAAYKQRFSELWEMWDPERTAQVGGR
jgi:phosphatidylserine/phosphatidylglycerophosphate/cardiolipin synthase-like enzyme